MWGGLGRVDGLAQMGLLGPIEIFILNREKLWLGGWRDERRKFERCESLEPRVREVAGQGGCYSHTIP